MSNSPTVWTDLVPYIVMIVGGFLPNEVWRFLGLVAARGIDENSEMLIWVRAVATATLTGVVAKIIIFPPGALAEVPLWMRLAALAIGVAAYLVIRKSVIAGVLIGTAVMFIATIAIGV
jgi:hypothetical protein